MRFGFYGRLGERLGREVELSLPPGTDTISAVRAFLAERFPDCAEELLTRSKAALGQSFAQDADLVADTDLIEFFPPLSGG